MEKQKKRIAVIILAVLVLGILAGAYFWGDESVSPVRDELEASSDRGTDFLRPTNQEVPVSDDVPKPAESKDRKNAENMTVEAEDTSPTVSQNGKVDLQDASVVNPEALPQTTADTKTDGLFCTLSVRCDTALLHADRLPTEKQKILPTDGILYPAQRVAFYEGENVFHVLQREMKKHKIHLEFVTTPVFGSAYIEGIGNLYEFDCGALSGWMFKVNGQFPGYGCSRHLLQNGDVIEWVYTCDLGKDVGDSRGIPYGGQKDA